MNRSIIIFKALSDETRLRILRALHEKESYVELLSERLDLTSATVSFHMKKLLDSGLIAARREQYYTIYSLKEDLLGETLCGLIFSGEAPDAGQLSREAQYKKKVLDTFMPGGYCRIMPAQVKKRLIILEEILSRFEKGREYQEQEVNRIIEAVHDDYCMVRRTFVEMDWMRREKGVYMLC